MIIRIIKYKLKIILKSKFNFYLDKLFLQFFTQKTILKKGQMSLILIYIF